MHTATAVSKKLAKDGIYIRAGDIWREFSRYGCGFSKAHGLNCASDEQIERFIQAYMNPCPKQRRSSERQYVPPKRKPLTEVPAGFNMTVTKKAIVLTNPNIQRKEYEWAP